jgi:NH3-dependent NAD+ synthetase
MPIGDLYKTEVRELAESCKFLWRYLERKVAQDYGKAR